MTSQLNMFRKTTDSKMEDFNSAMGKKVSEGTLKAALEASESKLKGELEMALKNDHMLRLGTVNGLKNSFSQAEKDIELKSKALGMKMQDLSEKYL